MQPDGGASGHPGDDHPAAVAVVHPGDDRAVPSVHVRYRGLGDAVEVYPHGRVMGEADDTYCDSVRSLANLLALSDSSSSSSLDISGSLSRSSRNLLALSLDFAFISST